MKRAGAARRADERASGRAAGGCPAASEVGALREARGAASRGPAASEGDSGGRERDASHLSQVRRRGAGRGSGLRLAARPPARPPASPGTPLPGRSLEAIVPGEPESKRPGLKGTSHPEREGRLRGRAAPGPQRAKRRAPLPVPFSVRPSPVAACFLPVRGHCITGGSVSGMCSSARLK